MKREWFSQPALSGPTPLTVDDDGRVFGHVALFSSCHIGVQNRCLQPPRSHTGYRYFKTGEIRFPDGGDPIAVGSITLGTGHAGLSLSADAAASHYDNTGSCVADVNVGEDQWGIWCAGAVRPGLPAEKLHAFRAAAPSGDWRTIRGAGLELVAILSVVTPGFPVPRAIRAAGAPDDCDECVLALTAAGVLVRENFEEQRDERGRWTTGGTTTDAERAAAKFPGFRGNGALSDKIRVTGNSQPGANKALFNEAADHVAAGHPNQAIDKLDSARTATTGYPVTKELNGRINGHIAAIRDAFVDRSGVSDKRPGESVTAALGARERTGKFRAGTVTSVKAHELQAGDVIDHPGHPGHQLRISTVTPQEDGTVRLSGTRLLNGTPVGEGESAVVGKPAKPLGNAPADDRADKHLVLAAERIARVEVALSALADHVYK